jgi:predicted nucleic acid-binding protein
MASPKVFFDANILLYTDDSRYPEFQQRSLSLIAQHLSDNSGAVSIQVLQEYFTNVTKKLNVEISLARQKTEVFSRFQVIQPVTIDIFAAVDLHRLHKIPFWDAMILRTAQLAGARILYTQDFQHERRFDSLQIINPFLR